MTDGVQYAGEFDIEEAILFSPNGEITDLMTDVSLVEINLYEDIFKSSITGSVVVADIADIITKLPIMGQEKISLKMSTPSLTEKKDIIDFSKHHFSVYRLGSREDLSVGSKVYELHFISTEAIKDSRKRVSKSYIDSKANIGDIVFDLLAEDIYGIQTSKEVFVEETTGTRNMVIPNSHPYSLITRLTKEAVSKNGSPHYVFFENKNGIHFVSLQSLYAQDVKAEYHGGDRGSDEEYKGGPAGVGDSGKVTQMYKRMIEYSINTKKNLLINSSTGMFGGRTIEHNIYNKRYKVKTFNYFDDEDFLSSERMTDNRVYSKNVLGKVDDVLNEEITNSKIHLIPVSKDDSEIDKSFEKGTPNRQYETLLNRQSRFLELHDGISINMTIHGNTTITVGDMVEVSIQSLRDVDNEDKYYSGLYMVRRLRHRFNKPARMHMIDMEVVRDGFSEKLSSGEDEVNKNPPTSQPTLVTPSGPR